MNHPEVKTRVDITKLCAKLGFNIGAEIGTAKGKFARVFFWNIPEVTLYCIDPWRIDPNDPCDYGKEHESNYANAKRILDPFNVYLLKEDSMEALSNFEDLSLDFVYIDANHSFDYAMRDIIEWSKKVKIGGIVSGHDYYRLRGFGVIAAVDAYANAHKQELFITTDDHTPSWFWIKK